MNYFLFIKYTDSIKSPLGSSEKETSNLIILDKEASSDELSLLENILKAINVDLKADSFVIDITNNPTFRINQATKLKGLNNIYLFGITPKSIGLHINMSKYHFINHTEIEFIVGDSLTSILNNKELKMALWKALKEKFID